MNDSSEFTVRVVGESTITPRLESLVVALFGECPLLWSSDGAVWLTFSVDPMSREGLAQ